MEENIFRNEQLIENNDKAAVITVAKAQTAVSRIKEKSPVVVMNYQLKLLKEKYYI